MEKWLEENVWKFYDWYDIFIYFFYFKLVKITSFLSFNYFLSWALLESSIFGRLSRLFRMWLQNFFRWNVDEINLIRSFNEYLFFRLILLFRVFYYRIVFHKFSFWFNSFDWNYSRIFFMILFKLQRFFMKNYCLSLFWISYFNTMIVFLSFNQRFFWSSPTTTNDKQNEFESFL